MRPKLIVIGGPTASGKTSLSIAIAQHYDCPILSSDSRQFFKEMNIGTAKPTQDELSQATHHFIGHLNIQQKYSVGKYEQDALKVISQVHQQGEVAIMVGGTGLYAKAVCEGLDDFPYVSQSVRQLWQDKLESEGIDHLQSELKRLDPDYYKVVDEHNPHRLIRALSVISSSDNTYSSFLNKPKAERPFDIIKVAIIPDRDLLYKRINDRVDQMILDGLIEEAQGLYEHRHLNSLNTVGYKELFKHFDGDWAASQAIDKIKQHSRNYAKRQMTWFRNQGGWHIQKQWMVEDVVALVNDPKS